MMLDDLRGALVALGVEVREGPRWRHTRRRFVAAEAEVHVAGSEPPGRVAARLVVGLRRLRFDLVDGTGRIVVVPDGDASADGALVRAVALIRAAVGATTETETEDETEATDEDETDGVE